MKTDPNSNWAGKAAGRIIKTILRSHVQPEKPPGSKDLHQGQYINIFYKFHQNPCRTFQVILLINNKQRDRADGLDDS